MAIRAWAVPGLPSGPPSTEWTPGETRGRVVRQRVPAASAPPRVRVGWRKTPAILGRGAWSQAGRERRSWDDRRGTRTEKGEEKTGGPRSPGFSRILRSPTNSKPRPNSG